jgi:hypothetical protein
LLLNNVLRAGPQIRGLGLVRHELAAKKLELPEQALALARAQSSIHPQFLAARFGSQHAIDLFHMLFARPEAAHAQQATRVSSLCRSRVRLTPA